jgi:hypothetical protein
MTKGKPYQRDPNGMRLDFRGMDTVHAPDNLPPNKYPVAQNVRRYLKGRVAGRATQDSSVGQLPYAVHSLRRLNDTTPAGPPQGYVLIAGASTNLYAGDVQVDTGFSGNPISLVPFRPNASVQPWMYVGDSVKMDKVRSDGTCYKMGIEEPQIAPTVAFIPASDTVSLLGAVTVYVFNNPSQSHSAPLAGVYIWKNAADPVGGSAVVETTGEAQDVATGNSLLFDYAGGSPGIGGNPDTYVNWSQYTTYTGTVNTSGTAVTWESGSQFGGLSAGDSIVISGVTYTITGPVTNTALTVTASAGSLQSVNYSAAVASGTVPLFVPALESEGYQDFNCSILATLYIPAAGTYTISGVVKDDLLWGIGNSANGTASWAGPTGGQTLSTIGQTLTTISAFPLIPRTQESSGEDGNWTTFSQAITFSAAGNYPIEFDWDYWYHLPRGLVVYCNGQNIPPIPTTTITDAQYRYTYRSSATGATSNPSPESAETGLSVLANNVTAVPSLDPQVDKVDWYRLDSGLENFTYVGTVSNNLFVTTTDNAVVSTGISSVSLNLPSDIAPSTVLQVGMEMSIDSGANEEVVNVLNITTIHFIHPPNDVFVTQITANFTKTHASGVQMSTLTLVFNDALLDTDIASNPILEFDNYEPFPSIDLPRGGVVSVAAGVVSWESGDQFNVRWLPGTDIIIGTVAYTLNTRPTSTTTLTATNVVSDGGIETVVTPPDGVGLLYEIAEPILAAQPLPYIWGPTDNVSFFYGVGDPLRPGTLYWSKGNNPDSAPDTNQQDVTSPSEPLQNGVIVNGYGWVASTERAWLIVPNFFNALATAQGVSGSTWTLQLSSLTRGVYIPRCLCVDGGGNVFFRAKDGIYISPGGQGGKSITDEDLYNLFPHEGFNPVPVTIGGFTVYPPDDTNPQAQKMNVANGYLYYDYSAAMPDTTTTSAVVTLGVGYVSALTYSGMLLGGEIGIDTGDNAETVTILAFQQIRVGERVIITGLEANFTKLHAAGALIFYEVPQTLVFDIAAGGWVVDAYQYPVDVHILEEGPGVNGVLCGCFDGSIRPLSDSGAETCISVLLTRCENAGDTRAFKYFGDVYIEAETVD